MTPVQKAAFDAIIGMARRTAMKIAELPKDERAEVLSAARRILLETAAEQGIMDSKTIELCGEAIDVVLREIEASGSPAGGQA